MTARFVGGCVRKHLSNDEIDDIDIATILDLKDKKKFNNTLKVVETEAKHGTVTLISKNLNLKSLL